MTQQRGNRQRQTPAERARRRLARHALDGWEGMGNLTRREREEWTAQHEGMTPQEWRDSRR